jgi:hypothetical protein
MTDVESARRDMDESFNKDMSLSDTWQDNCTLIAD